MSEITTKQCTKCHKIKDFSNYNKAKLGKYGLKAVCNDCRRKYREANKEELSKKRKERYNANKEAYAVRNAEYRRTHKEEIKLYRKEDYKANKEAYDARNLKYYYANREELSKKGKERYEANKEVYLARNKAWRDANKEHISAWHKRWRQTERRKIQEVNGGSRRRYLRRAAADGTIPLVMQLPLSEELGALLKNQNRKCGLCDCDLGVKQGDMHLDHIVPLSRGGVHGLSNVWWLCATCNLRKGTKLLSELLL